MSASSTSRKAAIAEAKITAAAIAAGIVVSRPVVEGARYDLVFDTDGDLTRVQCKAATLDGDRIVIPLATCRLTPAGYRRTTYAKEDVDAVAAYCAELDRCYLLPIELVERKTSLHLRLAAARNNQRTGVTMAAPYVLGL